MAVATKGSGYPIKITVYMKNSDSGIWQKLEDSFISASVHLGVRYLAFSNDDNCVDWSVVENGRVLSWQYEKNREHSAHTRIAQGAPGRRLSMARSPDHPTIAVGLTDPARISLEPVENQTAPTKLVVYTGLQFPNVIAFSPDGKTLAYSSGYGDISLVDPMTGKIRNILPAGKKYKHSRVGIQSRR